MRIRILGFAFGLALGMQCFALEVVHLKNGFSLEGQSHTEEEGMFILQVGTGTVTVSQNEVGSVEVVSPRAAPPQKKPQPNGDIEKLTADAAQASGADPASVRSVPRIESGLPQEAI